MKKFLFVIGIIGLIGCGDETDEFTCYTQCKEGSITLCLADCDKSFPAPKN